MSWACPNCGRIVAEGAAHTACRVLLERVVKAWESLPGNRHYTPLTVNAWLVSDMKPVMDAIRDELRRADEPDD